MWKYSQEKSNPNLVYSAFLVITNHIKKTGEEPSGLYFNKVMSLLHFKSKQKGTDIQLPHCWYRYGDEVVRYLMPTSIGWNHEEPPTTKVHWKGDVPYFNLEDGEYLKSEVELLTDQYVGKEGIKKAVDEVYAHAPFQFQRDFKDCRDEFFSINHRQIDIEYYGETVLLPLIERACASFPTEEFPEVTPHILAFKEAMKYVLSSSRPNYQMGHKFCIEFWEWFCYYLRLHDSAHENVSRETLLVWAEKIEPETTRYMRIFGDRLVNFSNMDDSIKSIPHLGSVIKERKQRIEEELKILASFDDDFNDLEKFLEHVRYRSQGG